jgi:hypothetical protein
MANSLIIPRCEVVWGDVNLMNYNFDSSATGLTNQPLVYNVRVSLQDSGQTPTGSMRWNPTGAAFSVYEKLLETALNRTITVRYYYLNGRSITFSFVWSGQTEVYGKEMSLEVKLASELDGLVNANITSTAQASDQGTSPLANLSQLDYTFGVEKYDLVKVTKQMQESLKTTKVLSNYSEGSNYLDSVKNLVEQTGGLVMATNIVSPGTSQKLSASCVVLGPYLSDKTTVEELAPQSQFPDPTVRYGYFLGPGIINTITKTSEWQPPQKTQTSLESTQEKVQPAQPGTQGQPATTTPQSQQAVAAQQSQSKSGAGNTANSRARPGVRLKENQDGEKRKLEIQQERSSKLSASVFMCPALTGVKPNDVIFIPNFSGTFIEDWIVNGIEYTQTDGGVEVSIQASRQYGLGNLMNKALGETWLGKAKEKNLIGSTGTLESWHNYAWGSLGFNNPAQTYSEPSSGQVAPNASGSTTSAVSDSFHLLAKLFGTSQTLVTDRGLYDYLTKELGIKFVNGSGVVDLPFEKVRQLNLRRIGKT